MAKKLVKDFLYPELTYKIRGTVFKVYNSLGFGHKEKVYHNALAEEFRRQNIDFNDEKALNVVYEGVKVGVYRPDFIVESKILIEIKAIPFLGRKPERQLLNYLKGTGFKLGLLINFGEGGLEIKRRIWSPEYRRESAIHRS